MGNSHIILRNVVLKGVESPQTRLREGGTGEIRSKFWYVFILIGNQIYQLNSKTTVSVFCDSENAFSQPCVQMNVQKCVTHLRNNLQ